VLVNLSAGDLVVEGQLAGNKFSDVFIRALEAAAIKPLQNNLIESDDAEPGSAWLFDLAEAIGHLDQEFSEITFEVNEERLNLSGILSSQGERSRVFEALGKMELIQWDPAESGVQIVAPVDPSLRIRVEAGEVSVSGEIARVQRETLSNALSGVDPGQLELTAGTWERLKTVERGYSLPIISQIPQILVFLKNRMPIVDVVATDDTLAIAGSYVADTQTSSFELEKELRDQLTQLIGEQIDQGMTLELSAIDWQLAGNSTTQDSLESSSAGDEAPASDVTDLTGLDDQGELKSVVEELRVAFSGFEFDSASSELNDEQMLILDQMFDTMFLYESLRVTIGVNAFELDGAEQNLNLSNQRADSITDYLTGLGLESNKYKVIGRGDSLRASDSTSTLGVTLSFGQK